MTLSMISIRLQKQLAEVKDNIYLIETKYDWLWGDSRYSIFLIKKNNNNLILIDYYIPDSINDPMEFYKVVNEGVEVISKSEKLLLNIQCYTQWYTKSFTQYDKT